MKKILAFIILFFTSAQVMADSLMLESGTIVPLKLANKVSSLVVTEGQEVTFIVSDDVFLGGKVLVKEGTKALGYISEVNRKGYMGKPGKIVVALDQTLAVDGRRVPLDAIVLRKGDDLTSSSIFGSSLFMPLTFFYLLKRGEDAVLPAGYKVDARVGRDVKVDIPLNSPKSSL